MFPPVPRPLYSCQQGTRVVWGKRLLRLGLLGDFSMQPVCVFSCFCGCVAGCLFCMSVSVSEDSCALWSDFICFCVLGVCVCVWRGRA